MVCLSLFVVLLIIPACGGSKYSAESNTRIEDFTTETRPYRMQKVNLLWQKAKKRLSGPKLAELYADLKVHDKHEAAVKKYRVDGMDKDGLKEAQVNAAFRELIEKYGLEELYHADGSLSNELPLDEEKKAYFADKKLQSMWERAEKAGFTARDLEKLREEFWHQQMKIDDFNFLKKKMEVEDVNDNEVDGHKKGKKSTEKLNSLNLQMKQKHKDVRAGYYDLEGMFDELERDDEPDFKDHRVHQLWALAQKTGWSEDELDSFKDELKHFETRLQKHEFLESQVQRSAENMKEEAEESQLEKHKRLEDRVQDMAFKVKKLHNDLKTRVGKAFQGHSEL